MVLSLTLFAALVSSLLATFFAERLTRPVLVIGSFVQLRLTHNPHIAFGIALPEMLQTVLILGALVAMMIVALRTKGRESQITFGFILGGAFANIFDRVSDGLVTDYLAVGTFPIFNVADIWISLGAGLLMLDGVRSKKGI
jgi:signal peptidase II